MLTIIEVALGSCIGFILAMFVTMYLFTRINFVDIYMKYVMKNIEKATSKYYDQDII